MVCFRWAKKPAGHARGHTAFEHWGPRLNSRVSCNPGKLWPSFMPDTKPTELYSQPPGLGSSLTGSSPQPSVTLALLRKWSWCSCEARSQPQGNGDRLLWVLEGSRSQAGPVKSVTRPLSEGFPTVDHSYSDCPGTEGSCAWGNLTASSEAGSVASIMRTLLFW